MSFFHRLDKAQLGTYVQGSKGKFETLNKGLYYCPNDLEAREIEAQL